MIPREQGTVEIVFIVNGEDVTVHAWPELPLSRAMRRALRQSGNTGRAPSEWVPLTERGARLDPDAVHDFKPGTRLFLTLKVGCGGGA